MCEDEFKCEWCQSKKSKWKFEFELQLWKTVSFITNKGLISQRSVLCDNLSEIICFNLILTDPSGRLDCAAMDFMLTASCSCNELPWSLKGIRRSRRHEGSRNLFRLQRTCFQHPSYNQRDHYFHSHPSCLSRLAQCTTCSLVFSLFWWQLFPCNLRSHPNYRSCCVGTPFTWIEACHHYDHRWKPMRRQRWRRV